MIYILAAVAALTFLTIAGILIADGLHPMDMLNDEEDE